MASAITNKKFVITETNQYGLGLFASHNIQKGTMLAIFNGETYEAEQCSKLPNDPPRLIRDHAIQYAEHKWRDSKSAARLANHSCEPNCGIKDLFTIVAMRDIKKGEEIYLSVPDTKHIVLELVSKR